MRVIHILVKNPRRLILPALAALVLSGCGSTNSGLESEDGTLEVMASFYPLQFATEEVGGDMVEVSSLTPPGAEPHNLELSPATVSRLDEADAVVYLPGFPAAVDDAVEQAPPEHILNVALAADLKPAGGANDEGHGGGAGYGGDSHGPAGADPHFWLDPARMAEVTQLIGRELANADPVNAEAYKANAEALVDKLYELDKEYTAGLANCERNTIVVSHEAYGYLADEYGLKQVGISGIDPEAAPSPVRLAKIQDVIEEQNVTTVFTESLVNPKVAQTLATDLGVDTALLSPAETLTDEDSNYLKVMRENLAALQKALNCE